MTSDVREGVQPIDVLEKYFDDAYITAVKRTEFCCSVKNVPAHKAF